MRTANLLFILAFFIGLSSANAQASNTIRLSAIRISGSGLLSSRIEKLPDQRLVRVYTAGGFITIDPDQTAGSPLPPHYYDAYYTNSKNKSRDSFSAGKGTPLYLKVGQEYTVDIRNQQTDSLIISYLIKRVQLIPDIMLYRKQRGHVLSTRISHNNPVKIQLQPGEKIAVGLAGIPEIDSTEIEYTLVNLKTRKTTYVVSNTGAGPFDFDSNTEYQLWFRYSIQQENMGSCYLSVQGYWYQSPVVYIALTLLLIAICLLTIIKGFKRKLRTSKAKQDKLEDAAIKLQSLLNPHFTFNALSTIQGLMNTGRIDEANLYLQEFSSLLRKALSKSQQVLNTLDQELDMMRLYIGLEALRFNFSWQIEVAETLHPTDIEIPTLLLQPLIENAVHHGMAGTGDKGRLHIICKEGDKKDTLVIIISDNGTWKQTSAEPGYGLRLTEARIQTANKLFHRTQSISLTFNKQSGTAAVLIFHNWINQ
ncbi:sensor histidine kinase [Chitinophaga pinensis]|uniref:Signal transduction histidine kinase, LytS n=1 Tax=Chitinophaga pinensis (strain ATCC 43595 / DSM 2588 / LMG 13176 / NBRC 15968 / NCIMB 11800 / UQM 2034) TaxID=485918 RepID=A0A979GTJ7_CHIPD|nr:histidine kinase [Chitinophaga pinensis]ACU60139.1 signal transduction histidine kinase, LytS [Chitinophaga pinensis DSM 2588]